MRQRVSVIKAVAWWISLLAGLFVSGVLLAGQTRGGRLVVLPYTSDLFAINSKSVGYLPDDEVLVRSEGWRLTTRSSAMNLNQRIVGKIDIRIKKVGWLLKLLHNPVALIAIVHLPALVIIRLELVRLSVTYRMRQSYGVMQKSSVFPGAAYALSGAAVTLVIALLFVFTRPVKAGLLSTASLRGSVITLKSSTI